MEQTDKARQVLSFEDLEVWIDTSHSVKIEPPERLHRLTFPGGRVYYRLKGARQVPVFYWGGTTFVDNVLPEADTTHLDRWMLEKFDSYTQYQDWMSNVADYGSFSHWQFGKFLRNRTLHAAELHLDLVSFMETNFVSFPLYFHKWFERVKLDLLAFRQWVHDFNVRPISSAEFPIYSDRLGVATQIDLVAYVDLPLKKDGQPYANWPPDMSKVENKVTVPAIIDFKSKAGSNNRGNFYPGEELQLCVNRRMWNDWYKNILPIEHVFNWSPKNWTSKPGYNFSDQRRDCEYHESRFRAYELLWKTAKLKLPERVWAVFDSLSLDRTDDYSLTTITEAIKRRHRDLKHKANAERKNK